MSGRLSPAQLDWAEGFVSYFTPVAKAEGFDLDKAFEEDIPGVIAYALHFLRDEYVQAIWLTAQELDYGWPFDKVGEYKLAQMKENWLLRQV